VQADLGRIASVFAFVVLAVGAVASVAVAARGGELDDTDWKAIGTLWAALLCGSAALGAVTVARRPGYLGVAVAGTAIGVASFAFIALAIWNDSLWADDPERLLKGVATALLASLTTLLVVSLRFQAPWTTRATALASLAVSALIVLTTIYALVLLWSWDAPFFDGGSGGGDVANVPQRILLVLFALSVLGYLALPLVARLMPPRGA
jgi:hypothetical protein